MASTQNYTLPEVRILTDEEAYQEFDALTRKFLDIGAEEFLRRWDAGEFADKVDAPEYHSKLVYILGFMSFARPTT